MSGDIKLTVGNFFSQLYFCPHEARQKDQTKSRNITILTSIASIGVIPAVVGLAWFLRWSVNKATGSSFSNKKIAPVDNKSTKKINAVKNNSPLSTQKKLTPEEIFAYKKKLNLSLDPGANTGRECSERINRAAKLHDVEKLLEAPNQQHSEEDKTQLGKFLIDVLNLDLKDPARISRDEVVAAIGKWSAMIMFLASNNEISQPDMKSSLSRLIFAGTSILNAKPNQ